MKRENNMAEVEETEVLPLFKTGWASSREDYVQFWALHFKKDASKLEQIWRRVTRMTRGLETKP